MARLKIFVSFEFDRDRDLKNNFYEQARVHTPHRIDNCSLNEAYPTQEWKGKARAAIRKCDVVVVLVGPDTHNAPGVRTEIDMARTLKRPVFQVVPRSRSYTGVSGIAPTIRWRWKAINEKLDEIWTPRQHA